MRNPVRGATSARLLLRLAAEHGTPPRRLLRGTGLDPVALHQPRARVTTAQELRLVTNLVTELGHVPGLGLQAGLRYRITTFGPLGQAALTSRTLGDAVALGLRYFALTSGFSPFRPTPTPHGLRTVIDDRAIRHHLGPDVARFLAERDMAAVATFVRDLLGDDHHLDHISFSHAPPHHADQYEQALGLRPAFDAPQTFGVASTTLLRTALPHADPHTTELHRRTCERHLANLPTSVGNTIAPEPSPRGRSGPPTVTVRGVPVAERVRAVLRERTRSGSGLVTQGEVAAEMGLSERSLRRRLATEGVSFRALAEETAVVVACEWLAEGCTVERTAARLGYSGASSFTHAFKRWTGTTPGRVRETGYRPHDGRGPE